MAEKKMDALDLLIHTLQSYEAQFDCLLTRLTGHDDKLEEFVNKIRTRATFPYMTAHDIVSSLSYAIKTTTEDFNIGRVLIQDFVATMNRRKLVPNEWCDDLVNVGIKLLTSS